ncbi:MAG: hypothetical protein WD960_09060 [Gemmatimonadota bacterium]
MSRSRCRWISCAALAALLLIVPSSGQAQESVGHAQESVSHAQESVGHAQESVSEAQDSVSEEGFRAWVRLFDHAHLGWLENENRIHELCGDAAVLDTCYADHLGPAISVYPLHSEADATSTRVGDLVVAAVPGRGLSAHFRAAGSRSTVPFHPDVHLQDWGYGPYFHQTILMQQGSWFRLPPGPWDEPVWIDRGQEDDGSILRVHAGDIIELAGAGHYVVEAEPDALVLRPEHPADLWCEAGDPPPIAETVARRVPRAELSDSAGRLIFKPRYMKGC